MKNKYEVGTLVVVNVEKTEAWQNLGSDPEKTRPLGWLTPIDFGNVLEESPDGKHVRVFSGLGPVWILVEHLSPM